MTHLRSRIALAAAGLAALAAVQASAQDAEITGELTLLGFSIPDEVAQSRLDTFRSAYPNVQLSITEGGLDEQQFLTAVASGTPPDVVYLDRAVLSTYAGRGALVPLTECIAGQGIDMSQFREAAVAQVTVDGVVYGMPEFFNTVLLIASGDALAEAGLTAEDVNTTDWAAIEALNDALTRYEGDLLTRIGFDPKLPEFLPLWAEANGVSLLSADGRTAQLDDPRVVEALEFAVGLHEAAGGRQDFTAFRDTWDFFGSGNQIASGQLGIFPMEQWYVNVLADVSPDANLVFAPFTNREGEPITYATGNAWAIPTGADNLEAACAFMATMTAADTWITAARARAEIRAAEGATNTGVYTANRAADEVIFGEIVTESGNPALDQAIAVILDVQDRAFAIPANPAGAEFRQAWTDAVNRVLNGEQNAADALAQAQAEAQAALDEAWAG
jgi:multiple sugar transport system substrate-binding protein